ncbi:unnamed protein product [Rotaria sp. Silwood1]|nr:unnamed protein product [Rotaria sp. Silwood1]
MESAIAYHHKRALVIGINSYSRDPLKCSISDAEDIKTVLERIGFSVALGIDFNRDEFHDMIDEFASRIQRTDLTLFYFAGHGKQSDNENYLLPSDYDYDYRGSERDYIINHAINAQYIMKKIDDKRCRITILIFDCCRKPVKDRSSSLQGLTAMHASSHTVIAFSCAPGKTALDETQNGRNSIFTGSLLEHIATPNIRIEDIFMNVAREVHSQSGGFQRPFRSTDLTEKVYLVTHDVSARTVRQTSSFDRQQEVQDIMQIRGYSEATGLYSKYQDTSNKRINLKQFYTGMVKMRLIR